MAVISSHNTKRCGTDKYAPSQLNINFPFKVLRLFIIHKNLKPVFTIRNKSTQENLSVSQHICYPVFGNGGKENFAFLI